MATPQLTTCRVRCEDCGDVRVRADGLVLRICAADQSAAFRFRCPDCELVHLVAASPEVISALTDGGVVIEWWSLPAELDERPANGQPIAAADVEAFRAVMDDDAAFVAALCALA